MTATTTLHSRADVTTTAPARYAKQLISHLGRKVTFTTDGDTSTVRLGEATGQVVVRHGVLVLLASGPDPESVAQVEAVLGRHLERFGARDALAVTWRRGGRQQTP